MNDMNVPSSDLTTADVLRLLADALPDLTPEPRKAAAWLLENPAEIGVSSLRQIAEAADVKPNTLVRMARALDFAGFEEFRAPFRENLRSGRDSFPDRARWLQSLARGGHIEALVADMAGAALSGVEDLYASLDAGELKRAADLILGARRTYALGVGIANPVARNFSYIAGMALDGVTAIPQAGSLPVDDLARAGSGDVLLAMTFKPWRREVVDAVAAAHDQGIEVIAISDSLAAPIMAGAAHRFVVPTQTPQMFTSTIALSAFLETLLAMLIAQAGEQAVGNIEGFHDRRHRLGIYCDEDKTP